MEENVALIKEIRENSDRGLIALIDARHIYSLTFDVVGECDFDVMLRDNVKGKILKTVNKHSQMISGSYKFTLLTLEDGMLNYRFRGAGKGIIENIKVIKGGK